MKTQLTISLLLVAGLVPVTSQGQETNPAVALQQLQGEFRQLQQNFERMQQQYRQQLEALQKRMDLLQLTSGGAAPAPGTRPVTGAVAQAVAPPSTHPPAAPLEPKQPWSPTAPIQLFGGQKSYMNVSFDALMAAGGSTAKGSALDQLEFGGHDPKQNGFTMQNLEMVLDGAVDPYFRAQANLVYQVDSSGESTFEVEEAYAETTALPGNFQVKAGQYVTEFGRLNPSHPHTWTFVDQPLVNGRMFGPEGLRDPGARVSWLAPTPFYSEIFLGIQDSQGQTAYSFRNPHPDGRLFGRSAVPRDVRSFGDLLFTPRYAVSLDLTEAQTVLGGVSAAFGPNASGQDTSTQVYGVDLFWKWRPVTQHGGFPFVSWQTEAMLRHYQAGAYSNPDTGQHLPYETLVDYGVYSQVAWGFKKGWVTALRGDWVSGDRAAFYPDPNRDPRWRVSPNLTWFPTEFSKIRLQYNYDHGQDTGVDHSVWLQFEFMLGAHAAHKF